MKYYSAPYNYEPFYHTDDNPLLQYHEIVPKLNKNYNLKEVIDLSKNLPSLTKQLINRLFYTYTNEIFDNLYITRFVLPQQQFCEIQHFIFSNPQGKGGSVLVPHLDTFFTHVLNEVEKTITENHYCQIYKYYNAAKQSDNSIFYQEQINLLLVKEHDLFHGYATDMKPFYEFVAFSKHTIAFNIFKDFLLQPQEVNPDYFFNVINYVQFKENLTPTLNEVSLFVKLMEQEHFDKIFTFYQTHNIYDFLYHIFFFDKPRPNAKSPFSYANQPLYNDKVVHLFNYDILDNINQKNINLNVLFNEKTPYHNFSAFVFSHIDKQLKNTDLLYDEDGYNHLLTLLKAQDYFYMNNKFPKKSFVEKHSKI